MTDHFVGHPGALNCIGPMPTPIAARALTYCNQALTILQEQPHSTDHAWFTVSKRYLDVLLKANTK
jgi:hypothetical protein